MSINQELLSQIKPHINGILWLTSSPLREVSEYHETLDSLVDGILYQFLNKVMMNDPEYDSDSFNYFVSQSFGSPFFLIHKKGTIDTKKDLTQIKNLLQSNSEEEELTLMIISASGVNFTKDLKKLGIEAITYT